MGIGNGSAGTTGLNGSIKAIIVYNTDQSANRQKIEASLNGLTHTYPGIVAHYRFDEGSGYQIADSSGCDHHGLRPTTGTAWTIPHSKSSIRASHLPLSAPVYLLRPEDVLEPDTVITRIIADGIIVETDAFTIGGPQKLSLRSIYLFPDGNDVRVYLSDGNTNEQIAILSGALAGNTPAIIEQFLIETSKI